MKIYPKGSIRSYLFWLVGLTTLPALAFVWHFYAEQALLAGEQVRSQLTNMTTGFAEMQRAMTTSARTLLETLATMPAIQEADAANCDRMFRSLLDKNPEYANIALISESGDMLASAKPLDKLNVAHLRHIQEAFATKRFTPGEYLVSPTTADPVFPFACPVISDGRVKMVLVAALRLTAYEDFIRKLTLPPDIVVLIVDQDGHRLFRLPDKPDTNPLGGLIRSEAFTIMSGPQDQGVFEMVSSDLIKRVYAFRRLQMPGADRPYVYILTGISKQHILAERSKERRISLFMIAGIAVLAFASALLLGEWGIVGRLKRITLAAGHIAKGDLRARSEIRSAPLELASLADAFDTMALAMQKRDTHLRRICSTLRFHSKRFRDIAQSLSDWIWELNSEGRFVFATGRVIEIVGYKPQEVVGRHFTDFLIPGERERMQAMFDQAFTRKLSFREMEIWFLAKNGQHICLRTNATPILDKRGVFSGYRGVCVDVTAQKAHEEDILQSLQEKEVLLKEIHHRVKNNLQIISSLLSLESQEFCNSPQVEEAFENMRGRVRSIALIHEKLYASEDFSAVEMSDYLRSLAGDIKETLAPPDQSISIVYDLAPLTLSLDQALPLALVANELVANSLKHAFGGAGRGEIRIRLNSDASEAELLVEDNGKGLPEEVKQGERHGLGFQLLMALADQLKGKIVFPETTRGASVMLRFPLSIRP